MKSAVALLALLGCSEQHDKTAACHLNSTKGAATIQDRKVIGGAAEYPPDLTMAARDGELASSIAARRAAAWNVVGKVLAPTQLAATGFQLPAWHTWFTHDDFERVFKKLYA